MKEEYGQSTKEGEKLRLGKLFYLKITFVNLNILYLSLEWSASVLQWNKMMLLKMCRDE